MPRAPGPSTALPADFVAGRTPPRRGRSAWQDLRPHDWTLLATLAGRGTVAAGAGEFGQARGDLLLVAPQPRRGFRSGGGWRLLWFHFLLPDAAAAALTWPTAAPGVFQLRMTGAPFRRTRDALEEVVELEALRRPGWYPLARCLVEGVLLRGNALGAENAAAEGVDDPRLARARELLRDYRDRRSMDAVAAACGLSRSVLYDGFKRTVGMSPRRYRELHALRRAQRLLESTGQSLAAIAEQVNLPDAYYLSARFKKVLGQSPSAYRRQMHGPARTE